MIVFVPVVPRLDKSGTKVWLNAANVVMLDPDASENTTSIYLTPKAARAIKLNGQYIKVDGNPEDLLNHWSLAAHVVDGQTEP